MEILRDTPPQEAMAGAQNVGETAPLEQRLAYGTSLHQTLVGRVRSRLQLSQRHISMRYDDWDRTEEHNRLYIDLSRKARKADRTTDPNARELPFERSIAIPLSYAVLQVRLTALLALFTAREPMIQVSGRSPEDVTPAKMIEALLAYDLEQMGSQMVLYGFFQNAEKFGLGILVDSWQRDSGWIDNPLQAQMAQRLGFYVPARMWGVTKEYFAAEAVDPYEFRPDPRVPGTHVDDMEFIGHRVRKGHTWLLERSTELGGTYINIRALRRAQHQRREQLGRSRVTDLSASLDMRDTADERDKGVYIIEYLQVRLIPREWGLGDETHPEIWQFAMAEDAVIIQAERRTNAHGQFGYSVAQSNYDPHAAFAPGMIENLDGIQRLSNWLYNSHIENVRRTMNDALIYAPSLIEENDLLNPGAARHVRLSRKGEELLERGMLGMDQMVKQLGMMDITAGHMREVQTLYEFVQRMTGVNDPAMGQPTDTKRTLGEIERILVSSSRRLAMTAQLYDAQAIRPLARRMIADRQQYTSQQQYVRITGRLAQELHQEQLLTNRENIQGNFDYMPISGTMPADPERTAQVWVDLLGLVSKAPQLMQPGPDGRVLNPRWLFEQVTRAMGIKNIEDAFIQVVPPQALQQGVQAGNMIPQGQAPPGPGRIPGAGIQGPMVPGGIPGAPPRGMPPGMPPQVMNGA